ncbi:MAG TPA: hypothetical protein VFX12_05400, partial [Vicinamibacterales bacterium]|nr:hypothetical protein [Vicinamibacterales bacterium]
AGGFNALNDAGGANFSGFDLNNPGNVGTPSATVGKYKTPLTHEIQIGLDHELMPNFGISGTYTYRRFVNFIRNNLGVTGADYEQVGTFNGTSPATGDVSVPLFAPIPGTVPDNHAATIYQTRPDYHQTFKGFEFAATKRMSNKWMARFGFSTNFDREYFDSPAGHNDPTQTVGSPNVNGGIIIRASGGSGKSSIYQVLPEYQFILTGLYQGPLGLNFGANVNIRQGFAEPFNHSNVTVKQDPLSSRKTILLNSNVVAYRLPTVTEFDARVEKEFKISRARLNLDLDVFNVLNKATVLGFQYDQRLSSANTVREIQNPLIARVGLRVNF